MKPPFLVFENPDFYIFRSTQQLTSELEVVDVEDNTYVAYDADGLLLDLVTTVAKVEHKFLWDRWTESEKIIVVREHTPPEDRTEEVRLRLIRYLGGRKQRTHPFVQLSLRELIILAGKRMPWKVNPPEP